MAANREVDKWVDTAERAYGRCSTILWISYAWLRHVRELVSKKWNPEDRSDVARLAKGMRQLNRLCDEVERGMEPVRAVFRAACDPPCPVNGKPHHSYHEGVLYLAKYELAAIDDVALDKEALEHLHKLGFTTTRSAKSLPEPRSSSFLQDDSGALEQHLVKFWKEEGERIAAVKIDPSELQCALDKEIAKVVIMIAGPQSAMPTPWSQPQTLAEWMKLFRVETRNTMSKQLRKMAQAGQAKKLEDSGKLIFTKCRSLMTGTNGVAAESDQSTYHFVVVRPHLSPGNGAHLIACPRRVNPIDARTSRMIDINEERLITLNAAARRLPRRPHVSTLYRWIGRGVRGVQLESVKVGGVTYTSREAMQRFANRLTTDHQSLPTSAAARDHQEKVTAEIARLGI